MSAFVFDYFPLSVADTLAMVLFLSAWAGYTYYAKYRAKRSHTLSSAMRRHREQWMREMLRRDNRISDATIIGNLERVVTFFASTTILILAGLLTAIFASENLLSVLSNMHLSESVTKEAIQAKLFVMALIFVYAFFKFTWSLRQYGFVSVMIGASPEPGDHLDEKHLNAHADRMARMSSMAANNFNVGLRTYYFSLAVLSWLINPWIFMALSAGVVYVLYQREFTSPTLKILTMSTDI